jgi:hypothetical protein
MGCAIWLHFYCWFPFPDIVTAQAMPYLPEDLNHFQEFTHFLDSIGLPGEWLPSEGETSQTQEVPLENVQEATRPTQDQQERQRRNPGESSRGDSPFRSWLPSVPKGDQSLGNLSDSGKPLINIAPTIVLTNF